MPHGLSSFGALILNRMNSPPMNVNRQDKKCSGYTQNVLLVK